MTGHKSVLLVDSKQQAATFNAGAYCTILEELRAAIKQICPGMLTKCVLFLHDDARPHSAKMIQQFLQYFWWEFLEHPVYSPDLVPSDYHLFPALKNHLSGHKFQNDDDVKIAVTWWLYLQDTDCYQKGNEGLVPQYNRCLNCGRDYLDK